MFPIRRLDHSVSLVAEEFPQQAADSVLVLNQQDRLATFSVNLGGYLFFRHLFGLHALQVDSKRGPPTRFTLDADVTFTLLDDSVDGGQTKARACGSVFGRKEGFEDVLERLRVYSLSVVTHCQRDPRAETQFRIPKVRRCVDLQVLALDTETSALWHGIAGIDCEIQQN